MRIGSPFLTGTLICWLACAPSAKGGGGHGGGGHSGGHAASGGGHAAGGHSSGGTHPTGRSGHAAAPRTSGTSSGGSGNGTGHPRGGYPTTGTAIARPFVAPSTSTVNGATILPSRPFPIFGLGLGFGSFYSPFWSLYGYSYSGYGYGYGFTPYPFDEFDDAGSLRLQVEPKDAAVYVDGYYAGIVDDFDGHFQHVNLTPGAHHLEIVAPDFEPLAFDVAIEAHHKTTYRGVLTRNPTE
jgi:hypothetical protein